MVRLLFQATSVFASLLIFAGTVLGLNRPQVNGTVAIQEKHKIQFTAPLSSLAISEDGTLVAAGDEKGNLTVFEVATQKEKTKIKNARAIASLSFFAKGAKLVAGTPHDIVPMKPAITRAWEVDGGKVAYTLDEPSGSFIVLDSTGKTLVCAGAQGIVRFRDAETGALRKTYRPHQLSIAQVALSPDGKTFATASSDKSVKICDVQTGEELLTMKHPNESATSVSFSPCGKWLASSGFDKSVFIWDAKKGKLEKTIPRGGAKVAFSPNGKWLAIGGSKLSLYETTNWGEVASVEKQLYGHRGIVFTPDSNTMITACGFFVRVFEISTAKAEKGEKKLGK